MKQDSAQSGEELALLSNERSRERAEDEIDAETVLATLADIERDPSQLARGEELSKELREVVG